MAGNKSLIDVSSVTLQHPEHRLPLGEAPGSDQAIARGTQADSPEGASLPTHPLGESQSEELPGGDDQTGISPWLIIDCRHQAHHRQVDWQAKLRHAETYWGS